MPCYHPHRVYRDSSGQLDWHQRVDAAPDWLPGNVALIPCSKCIGCKASQAREWAIRAHHEALLHRRPYGPGEVSENCVVTLTYDQMHLPSDGLLDHSHFKRFLRKLGNPRHFMCGEYGGKTHRPHYHAILFGYHPGDLEELRLSDGQVVKYSEEIQAAWCDSDGAINGMATVDDMSFAAAGYVAGYVAKKLWETFDPRRMVEMVDPVTGETRFEDPGPEYRRMSRRKDANGRGGGLGADWIAENLDVIYPADVVVINEYKFKPPQFYDRLLRKLDPVLHSEVLVKRLEGEAEHAREWTPQRAEAAEKIFLDERSARRTDSL